MIHPDRLRWLGVLLGARQRPAVPGSLAPRSARVLLLAAFLLADPARSAEVQLQCQGTLLEARGSAERKRPLARLAFSLNLEAEAPTADGALGRLQARLAAVRTALQALGVEGLEVGSPSTWTRPAEPGRPAVVQANLPVAGKLAAPQLQGLVRRVGVLPGVRLAPVSPEADPAGAEASRQALLAAAFQDAEAQVRPLAQLIGRTRLVPLQIQVEGGGGPVMMRAAMAEAAPPPFDPAELPKPTDRLAMLVQFCAVQNRT
jgi:uncharacterized protein YggE